MTKNIFILFILFSWKLAIGQTDETVKHIFLDLPLDKPRADIQKFIKSDKRFRSTDADTNDFNMFTYIGLSSDYGVIKSHPDSVEVELTYGGPNNMTFITVRYFYTSRNTVDKEYQRVLSMFRPIFKDTLFSRIDTVYSDSPIRSQFKSYQMTFRNSKSTSSIDVANVCMTKNYFGLFIEYRRKEE
jgi:hypothetical protein